MNANHRFAIVGIALSSMACASLILVSLALVETSPGEPAEVAVVAHLRPTFAVAPGGEGDVDAFGEGDPGSRLSFVSPTFDDLSLLEGPAGPDGGAEPPYPEGSAEAGTDPDTWSVEVEEQPLTDAQPRTSRSEATGPRRAGAKQRRYSLKERLAEISPGALARLTARFEAAKAAWPPAEVAMVAIKDAKSIELYARATVGGIWQLVDRYKVLAASGTSGPKLVMGDKQVPEGVYRISYLNPNSAYHVSLRVDYPNAFDRAMAAKDGRKTLGGDIMIHGKNLSAGCLAVGDAAAEELFVLAAQVGLKNVKVVIAPTDFRRPGAMPVARGPHWLPQLYADLAGTMTAFPAPPPPPAGGLLSLLGL
ncbi:MAG: L,D-transpeptidase family protein [Hyphomicrobiaceae bacterium]|nr:L,D-transpeptidase family protein [Hyphomicrobiaceae bacterium]